MISTFKSIFSRRVSGSTVAPATPNAAPVPAGLVAMTPAEAAEHARKLDERKAAFHAKQAQQASARASQPDAEKPVASVEAPKVESKQPSVAASTELPKAAPKPDPIPQASVAPVKAATPKPAVASTPGKVTVATSATPAKGSCTGSIRLGNFRLNRSEAREVAFSSVYGIARDVSELCDPYDSQWNLRDAPRVMAVTMKDAAKIRAGIVELSSKPRKGSAQHHWADRFSVMSLNASNEPQFIERSIIDESREANADLILVLERASTLVAFGDPDRMQFAFDRIAQATGSAVGILRSVKDC